MRNIPLILDVIFIFIPNLPFKYPYALYLLIHYYRQVGLDIEKLEDENYRILAYRTVYRWMVERYPKWVEYVVAGLVWFLLGILVY